jgi:hypothetical protein
MTIVQIKQVHVFGRHGTGRLRVGDQFEVRDISTATLVSSGELERGVGNPREGAVVGIDQGCVAGGGVSLSMISRPGIESSVVSERPGAGGLSLGMANRYSGG